MTKSRNILALLIGVCTLALLASCSSEPKSDKGGGGGGNENQNTPDITLYDGVAKKSYNSGATFTLRESVSYAEASNEYSTGYGPNLSLSLKKTATYSLTVKLDKPVNEGSFCMGTSCQPLGNRTTIDAEGILYADNDPKKNELGQDAGPTPLDLHWKPTKEMIGTTMKNVLKISIFNKEKPSEVFTWTVNIEAEVKP